MMWHTVAPDPSSHTAPCSVSAPPTCESRPCCVPPCVTHSTAQALRVTLRAWALCTLCVLMS